LRFAVVVLCLTLSAFGQTVLPTMGSNWFGPAGIVIDGAVTPCSGHAVTGTTVTCSLTSITAGDLIACPYAFDSLSSTSAIVSDSLNSAVFTIAVYENAPDGNDVGADAMAYFANSASGSDTITLTTGSSDDGFGLTCSAWKNARTTSVVDSALWLNKNQGSSATNPTAGTSTSPTGGGELIFGELNTSTTPTAGANYTLQSGMSAITVWAEYWAQVASTSTNCPYTAAASIYSIYCMAFLPNTASAGVTPATMFINFEGTNTVAPTAASIASTSFGFAADQSGRWTCTNTHTDITYATAAQLSNMISSQFVNGTTYTGSGSTGFKYATGSNGDGCKFVFDIGLNAASVGFWTEWTIPNNDSASNAYSMVTLSNAGGNDYFVMQLQPSGTVMQLRGECKFATTANFTATLNTLYWITMTMQTNPGACTPGTNCALNTFTIYNSSGVQQAQHTCSSESGNNPVGTLIVGNTGAETQSSGDAIYFDDLVMNVSSTSVGP
jgi:hypothetical protein